MFLKTEKTPNTFPKKHDSVFCIMNVPLDLLFALFLNPCHQEKFSAIDQLKSCIVLLLFLLFSLLLLLLQKFLLLDFTDNQ